MKPDVIYEIMTAVSSPGLRRGLQIIDALARDERLGFTDLRRELDDVSAPTLSRLLKVLVDEGWVIPSSESMPGYRLGPRSLAMAGNALGADDPERRRREAVQQLAEATGESAAWVRWDGRSICFELKHEMPDSYHYMAIGRHNDGIENGFVLAAHVAAGNGTAAQRGQLAKHAVVEHHDRGLRVVAPVVSAGQVLGLVGISALVADFTADQRAAIYAAVRQAATDITATLESSAVV